MTSEQRRTARYLIPALYAVALVAGLLAHAFVPVAIIGALLSGVAHTAVGMLSRGERRQRNRDRERNRD